MSDYPLNQIYFYLTEGCNLACRHCWLAPPHDSEGNKYPALPVRLFEAAVSEGKALGVKRVKLTGGEPLLHPDILTLIDIVYREELSIAVESNGLLCTAAVAAAIARFPDKVMSISLDGADAATHERIRGGAGSFTAACAAVQLLAAHGVKPQIIMTVMGSNRHQIDAMVRLAERLGAASVKFNLVQPTARGKALLEANETPGMRETLALGRYVEGELACATDLRLHFDYPVAFRPMSRIAQGRGAGTCGVFGIIGVLPTGQYALCGIGKHIPDLVFGEIGKDRLAFVWEHNAVLCSLRKGIPDVHRRLRPLHHEADVPWKMHRPELLPIGLHRSAVLVL
jgi:SynChlorMet cassette radical SAM/SPASM protein ScmF